MYPSGVVIRGLVIFRDMHGCSPDGYCWRLSVTDGTRVLWLPDQARGSGAFEF